MLKEVKRKDNVGGNDVKMFHEVIKICVTAATSNHFEKSPLDSIIIHISRIFNPPLICTNNKVLLMKK